MFWFYEMKLYFIDKNDRQWSFGLKVWSSWINEKEKFILSIRFANLMVFLSYLTVCRILHITYAKVMDFSLYKTRGIVPDGEIREDWKFFRCGYAIWNFGVLQIRFKFRGNFTEIKLGISWQKNKYQPHWNAAWKEPY